MSLIAERTSAKAVAARKRGLWTGGTPAVGYTVVDKKLTIVPREAEQIREVFRLFAESGSLVQVIEEIDRRGFRMKGYATRSGKEFQARPFTTTRVKRILTNPVYAAKTVVAGKEYAGAHEAIIDEKTWRKIQDLIANRRTERRPWRRSKHDALLHGLVRCGACGSAMTVRYSQKRTKRYHYYCCLKVVKAGAGACPGSQVSAARLEVAVVEQIRAVGKKPDLLNEVVQAMEREQAERRPELEAKLREVEKDMARLEQEQKRLVAAVADAKGGRKSHRRRAGGACGSAGGQGG